MPNYLARIAIAANRTPTAARPAKQAMPIFPGSVPAADLELLGDGGSETSGHAAAPAPTAPTPASPPSEPLMDSNESAADAAQAQQAQVAEPSFPQRPALSGAPKVVRVPKALTASAPGPGVGGASRMPPAPSVPTIVQAPRAISRRNRTVDGADDLGSPIGVPTPSIPPATVPSPAPAGEPRGAAFMEPSRERAAGLPANRQEGAPAAVTQRPAAVPPMGTLRAQRESRVSIGQIDVQVINQPPVAAAARPATSGDQGGGASESRRLELERFGWRLS